MSAMIPVCRPYFTGKEKTYVNEALDSGWISSSGKFITQFEEKFSKLTGCKYGAACSNGTAAVHLALLAAGVGVGDRVVVPSFTMMASIFPILVQGAIPVAVDCDPESWTLDPKALEVVEGKVKAVMPVHIYGHPCDMDPILAWAKNKKAVVIEDAAEAHGATYKGKPIGSLSDMAAFSFYTNKIMMCGEGGMVVSNQVAYADKAKYFRNLCFDLDPEKRFIHEGVGYNFRLTNLQAAIAMAQIESAEHLISLRRAMAKKYQERLKNLEDKLDMPVEKFGAKNVYWMYGVVLKEDVKLSVPEVRARLAEKGVETRRFFCPAHLQPALKNKIEFHESPESERLWERGFYIPSSSDLTDKEADQVTDALKNILSK